MQILYTCLQNTWRWLHPPCHSHAVLVPCLTLCLHVFPFFLFVLWFLSKFWKKLPHSLYPCYLFGDPWLVCCSWLFIPVFITWDFPCVGAGKETGTQSQMSFWWLRNRTTGDSSTSVIFVTWVSNQCVIKDTRQVPGSCALALRQNEFLIVGHLRHSVTGLGHSAQRRWRCSRALELLSCLLPLASAGLSGELFWYSG